MENEKFWKRIHRGGILFINGTLLGVAFFFSIRTGLTGVMVTEMQFFISRNRKKNTEKPGKKTKKKTKKNLPFRDGASNVSALFSPTGILDYASKLSGII